MKKEREGVDVDLTRGTGEMSVWENGGFLLAGSVRAGCPQPQRPLCTFGIFLDAFQLTCRSTCSDILATFCFPSLLTSKIEAFVFHCISTWKYQC